MSTASPNSLPTVLTIAASDSGAQAGIQADLKTFTALGVFGTCAVTAVTAQNPDAVVAVEPVSPQVVEQQIIQVHDYFAFSVIKTGLLPNAETIKILASFLDRHPSIRAVVDPVMIASSGRAFLDAQTVAVLKQDLLPRADLITPNLDEVEVLLGYLPDDQTSMTGAAEALAESYNCAVLVKGGHLPGDDLVDVLYDTQGVCSVFSAKRIKSVNSHGSGCTLASAIAAGLAKGLTLQEAVTQGHDYLQGALRCPVHLGSQSFIQHAR